MTIRKKEKILLNEQEELIYQIIDDYSTLNTYCSPDFLGLNKEKKISTIIRIINDDDRFSKLNCLLGAILRIDFGNNLCIRTGVCNDKEERLYGIRFDDIYSQEYKPKSEILKRNKDLIAEHIKQGLVDRLERELLKTGKFKKIKLKQRDEKMKRKWNDFLLQVDNSDEKIVDYLKEQGYSYDLIREISKDLYLKLDEEVVENVLKS